MDQVMSAAIEEARIGAEEGGIPIGATLADKEGRLIAAGRNRRVQDRAVVMHAEINCLFNAGKVADDFRGMTVYSTLIPCQMCAAAIVQLGIAKVVVGESENFHVPETGIVQVLASAIPTFAVSSASSLRATRPESCGHNEKCRLSTGRRQHRKHDDREQCGA